MSIGELRASSPFQPSQSDILDPEQMKPFENIFPGSSQPATSKPERSPEPPKSNVGPLIGAAVISGLPADVVAFPFSRIKTVEMTQKAAQGAPQFQGMRHAATTIVREQGAAGLFRGMSPVVASSVPGTTLFFVGMQKTKDLLGDSAPASFASGIAGQLSGSIVWVPSEVLKELRQMTVIKPELQNMSVPQLAGHIVQKEGVKGLYRGTLAQLGTFGIFNGIGTALAPKIINRLSNGEKPKVYHSFIGNSAAFGLAAAWTTPLDVVKTRIQVGAANPELFPNRSIVGCAKRIYATEGLPGFCSGTKSRVCWLAPRQGIAYTAFGSAYEFFMGKA